MLLTTPKPNSPAYIALLLLTITTFLLVLVTTLLLLLPFPFPFSAVNSDRCQKFLPLHHDRSFVRTYHEDPILTKTTLNSLSQPSWETYLLPRHGGGQIFNAKPGSDKIIDHYGISMFHQLHCLIMLRGVLFPETSQRSENSSTVPHRGDKESDEAHWAHCFDYIAQAILCAADDAIEPPDPVEVDGQVIQSIDGMGVEHQCKDARVLWEYTEQSYREPVDMSRWSKGMGAREFLKGKFTTMPENVPPLYSLKVQRPV